MLAGLAATWTGDSPHTQTQAGNTLSDQRLAIVWVINAGLWSANAADLLWSRMIPYGLLWSAAAAGDLGGKE